MNFLCPICKGEELSCERRPNGNATCVNRHTYPMKDRIIEGVNFNPYVLQGGFKTVGELRELLKDFDDSDSIGFINQPLQRLWAKREDDGEGALMGFQ